jgi:hypothetical protein
LFKHLFIHINYLKGQLCTSAKELFFTVQECAAQLRNTKSKFQTSALPLPCPRRSGRECQEYEQGKQYGRKRKIYVHSRNIYKTRRLLTRVI